MVEDVLVGFEDPVGEPVVAHVLPDILDRTLRRQRQERNVLGHHETARQMPAGLIEEKHGMRAGPSPR